MRRLIYLFVLTFNSLSFFAQNSFPTAVGSNVILDGSSINLKKPNDISYWSRGLHFLDENGAVWGGMGILANGTTKIRFYLANGSAPWTSGSGIYVADNGYVGIGTTSISYPLTVTKDLGVTSSENFLTSFNATTSPLAVIGYRANGTSITGAIIRAANNYPLFLGTSSYSQNLTLLDNGKIGIGTTSPQHKLEVLGNISANRNGGVGASFLTPSFGLSNNYLLGLGLNLYFNGTDWVSTGDGGNNAAGLISSSLAGGIGFYAIPSTGGSGLTITKADLETYKKMTIMANGKVGIGNNNPPAFLTANSPSGPASTTGDNTHIYQFSSVGGTSGNVVKLNLWSLRDASGSDWLTIRLHEGISVDGSYGTPGTNTKVWYERDPYHGIHSWGNDGNRWMSIVGGNVGIGTPSPSDKLQVNSSEYNDIFSIKRTEVNQGNTFDFRITSTPNGKTALNSRSLTLVAEETAADIAFIADPASQDPQFIIKNNGNILINKTSQTNTNYKLDINGIVRANEVVINTDGADFVFSPDYKLRSLSEVEKHIKEKGYLPEVPSANDMQQNGIGVSEMQTLLLQKVEELTLYVIELKKQNESLQNQVNELKK